MARILICHVPKDGSIARDLGAMLMGRGHFVSFDGEPDTLRPDRPARLRQFESVLVIWTEHSLASAGLAEIAREIMPMNLLVPVRAENVSAGSLPLIFRKLNMLAPKDMDGIARAVARISTAASSLKHMAAREAELKELRERERREQEERGQAARETASRVAAEKQLLLLPPVESGNALAVRRLDLPQVEDLAAASSAPRLGTREHIALPPASAAPQPQKPLLAASPPEAPVTPAQRPVATAEDLGRLVEAGLLVSYLPDVMLLAEATLVEVRLDRDVMAGHAPARPEREGMPGHSPLETISVSLYGAGDIFEIERQSERTQFVTKAADRSVHDRAPTGRWAWLVTPRRPGEHDLVVRVSALLRDARGVPTPVAIPDRRIPVRVDSPEGGALLQALSEWRRE